MTERVDYIYPVLTRKQEAALDHANDPHLENPVATMNDLGALVILRGNGNPSGVIIAAFASSYIDLNVNVFYRQVAFPAGSFWVVT